MHRARSRRLPSRRRAADCRLLQPLRCPCSSIPTATSIFPELAAELPAVLAAMRAQRGHARAVHLRRPARLAARASRSRTAHAEPLRDRRRASRLRGHARARRSPSSSRSPRARRSSRIGETGLDYYRLDRRPRLAARALPPPHPRGARGAASRSSIHTRAAADDTLAIMREERRARGRAASCTASPRPGTSRRRALDLGFHISFSGIVTFKNADELKDVARRVPLDRMLIETDSPYLAPVPYRGKRNQPACVPHVAEEIARLRGVAVDDDRARRRRPISSACSGSNPMRTDLADRSASPSLPRSLRWRSPRRRAAGALLSDDLSIAVANDRVERVKDCSQRGVDPNTRRRERATRRSSSRRARATRRPSTCCSPRGPTSKRAQPVRRHGDDGRGAGGHLDIVKTLRARARRSTARAGRR